MNTENDDGRLRALLREHCAPQPPRNAGFRAAVWRRIEARRAANASWGGWLRANSLRVAACAVACIALATAAGRILGGSSASREREQLLERYVTSIDALQKMQVEMPAHAEAPETGARP